MRILAPLLLLATACGPHGTVRGPRDDADTATSDTATSDSGTTDSGTTDTSADPGNSGSGSCPSGMALVDDTFCIDRYEATLQERDTGGAWSDASPYETVGGRTVRATVGPGRIPQAYVSGDEAELACVTSGKRLCTSTEWLAACQGPDQTTWPYGNTYEPGACNDTYDGTHPVVDYFGTSTGVWDTQHMNDPGIDQQPGTVARGGSYPECVSAWGVYDLHGNLHEWVDDADGAFRGGFFADASLNGPGCLYVTTAHTRAYHDYSTGFRCCADPR